MADKNRFIELMAWWCLHGNLGYDQSQRQNIWVGGECDCSSLVIEMLRRAGFDVGAATYTGNMSRELTKRGWKRVSADGNPQPGDILLNDANHVAVYLGNGKLAQASIDERGRIAGGRSGDQTDSETNVRGYYDYPWDCYLRYVGGETAPVDGNFPGATQWNPNAYDEQYVRQVQELLNEQGYSLTVDGVLGPKTFAAIEDYQRKHGLLVDGIPGPSTMGTLKSPDSTSPASRAAHRYADIRAIQEAVHAKADNVSGPDTRRRVDAVRKASKWAGETFPYGVRFAQNCVGAEEDDIWGDQSVSCHDDTVAKIQRALGLTIDKIWGPITDAAVTAAINTAEQA